MPGLRKTIQQHPRPHGQLSARSRHTTSFHATRRRVDRARCLPQAPPRWFSHHFTAGPKALPGWRRSPALGGSLGVIRVSIDLKVAGID
jgi:hypothetical protein